MKKSKKFSLTALLKEMDKNPKTLPDAEKEKLEKLTKELQLDMLKSQQGVFHKKDRVVIIFEGFDAAGKGGAIRRVVEGLDPRSMKVVPIAAPKKIEQGKHWLYRFWRKLPPRGHIKIFDRSWYGRVLVEKVEKLTDPKRLKQAYDEINEFERQLQDDGIILIKIFLAITKDEQLNRFEERLKDPFKQWKITEDDVRARKHWDKYVDAVDEFLKHNSTKSAPWHVVQANSKKFARKEVLRIITEELSYAIKWIEKRGPDGENDKLVKLLRKT